MKSDLLQPEPRLWLSSSVIASAEDGYVAHLRAGRYHSNTVRVYLAIAPLNRQQHLTIILDHEREPIEDAASDKLDEAGGI